MFAFRFKLIGAGEKSLVSLFFQDLSVTVKKAQNSFSTFSQRQLQCRQQMFKVGGKLYSLFHCTTKVLGAIDHSKVIDYK
jgi:hypothetical protein